MASKRYNTNSPIRRCLAVVFQPIIERELNNFKVYWNTHKIRKSHGDTIDGIPDDLYQMPVYYGKCDIVIIVNNQYTLNLYNIGTVVITTS